MQQHTKGGIFHALGYYNFFGEGDSCHYSLYYRPVCFISKCKNTVRESGFDISDMSKPDSQLHWTLILIGAGGLCIALNALFKLFGWN